jgi:5-methylcytosine-specific restriction endonuclease McrA
MTYKKIVVEFVSIINEFCLDEKKGFSRPKDLYRKIADKKIKRVVQKKSKIFPKTKSIQCSRWKKIKKQTQSSCPIERKKIRGFYKKCPIGYEVDHIVPLSKGGVHRLFNLQYLKTYENRCKRDSIEHPILFIDGKKYQYIPIVPKPRELRKYKKISENIVHNLVSVRKNFHSGLAA